MTLRRRFSSVRSVTVLLLFCSGLTRGGEVRFQRLALGGWANFGIFAEDVDDDGLRDILSFDYGRVTISRAQKGDPPTFPKKPELLRTGTIGYFADVADMLPAKGKELLLLTPTGVMAYIQEDGRYVPHPVQLMKCETLLTTQPARGAVAMGAFRTVEVLPWNFAFDANGDGRDDLLIPHGGGTDVRLQTKPGTFGDPTVLPLLPGLRHRSMVRGGADYLRGKQAQPMTIELHVRELTARDVNGDGKDDLVCSAWWFAQKLDGTFDAVPAELPPDQQALNTPESIVAVDINGDGRLDRIEVEHSFDDPFNIATTVRYWLADATGAMGARPAGSINGPNILVDKRDVPIHDFNGDGAQDFVLFSTDLTPARLADWLRQAFGKIDGKLNFFLFDRERNRFDRSPSVRKNLNISFRLPINEVVAGLVWVRFLGTMVRLEGDFNGDGRPDLMVRDENRRVSIYHNIGGRDLYPRKPHLQIVDMPEFTDLHLDDLNGDGASDLILYGGGDSVHYDDARTGHVIAVYISQLK